MRFANALGRAVLIASDGRYVDIERATGGEVSSDPMLAVGQIDSLRTIEIPSSAERLNEVTLLAPIPRPTKILGAAINFYSHAEELGFDIPDQPILFSKLPSSVTGPTGEVVIPRGRTEVDWEAELVVVIGRRAHRVPVADAYSYVAGYTVGQDVSDRQEQFRSLRQFTMGKSYDTFSPIGPVMVTPDELGDLNAIDIVCWVDGEEVQNGNTSDWIFAIPETIAWISHLATLEVGDLIFMGTPSGVGRSRTPPKFLEDGNLLEAEIANIGRLANRCVAGEPAITVASRRP